MVCSVLVVIKIDYWPAIFHDLPQPEGHCHVHAWDFKLSHQNRSTYCWKDFAFIYIHRYVSWYRSLKSLEDNIYLYLGLIHRSATAKIRKLAMTFFKYHPAVAKTIVMIKSTNTQIHWCILSTMCNSPQITDAVAMGHRISIKEKDVGSYDVEASSTTLHCCMFMWWINQVAQIRAFVATPSFINILVWKHRPAVTP